ncbi:MAG: alpha/beta hydrolase [Lentisphaerae bacterium]|jgi:pimeloyl-ACP methyl ester carboxylesterase|nr:alpha/beta hydrolase [Lentisphaerota bacterium]
MTLPGEETTWFEGYTKYEFEVAGKTAVIVCPKKERPGKFWAWKGEFLNEFPGTELALLAEGFYIVHLRFPDQFGSPVAISKWNELYDLLTGKFGFHKKVALIGLSRGGLYCYNWAIANPEKTACIFGDAAVADFRSWPMGKGKGPGSKAEWEKFKKAFGYTSDADAEARMKSPIDNLGPLAKAKVPILNIYGDKDEPVPWEENAGELAKRYKALGGDIELIVKPGVGHHPHGLEDPAPIVKFIERHTAGEGN